MKHNWKYGNLANDVTLPLPVPTGTAAGDVIPIGDQGLLGYAVTDRATTSSIAAGEAAPGLKDGEASVRLLPAQGVIEVPVADSSAFDVGDVVYGAQNGGTGVVTYSTTNTGYPVGFVTAKPTATSVFVFLGSHLEVTISQT